MNVGRAPGILVDMNTIRAGTLVIGLAFAIIGCNGRSDQPAPERTPSPIEADVRTLAETIGERNLKRPEALERAAVHIEGRFRSFGDTPSRQAFVVDGLTVANIEVERKGGRLPTEIVIVGAHYDSAPGTLGADDNATGVAGMLEIAGALSGKSFARTLRFVAFVNEEPPFFQTERMGSVVYARRSRQRDETIVAMLALESIGYYSDAEGSQRYPPPLDRQYPSRGNFIAFVGNEASKGLVDRCRREFSAATSFPMEWAVLPERLPGIGWSDHWSFWREGYPAVMITDTAPFRNPSYHKRSDTPGSLDWERTATVVAAISRLVERFAEE